MLIKVCGLRSREDIFAAAEAGADYIGLNFYSGSPRFVDDDTIAFAVAEMRSAFPSVRFTGVFVNEHPAIVRSIAQRFQLDSLQFHGDEDALYCSGFKNDFEVIKAISIQSGEDFQQCEKFEQVCQAFLFDTSGVRRGGNGYAWDWRLLEHYKGVLPFFLSGGIAPGEEEKLLAVTHSHFIGADINSRFEHAPAKKNNAEIRKFITTIKSTTNAIHG